MSELYELPNGWEWKTFDEVSEFVRGITFKPNEKYEEPNENSIYCFRTTNIQSELDDSDLLNIDSSLVKSDDKIVKNGDILISSANSLELLGKCCLVRDIDYKATLGGFIVCGRPNQNVLNTKYYYYYFSSEANQNRMRNLANKTTGIANLPMKKVEKQYIPLPPLSEQQRIVSKLDKLFEKIDKSIALHQKNMDEADVFMGSVLNDVFGELEEKYEYTKLKDVVTKEKTSIKRGPFGSALKKSFFVESGYLVYEQYHALNNDFTMERYYIDEEKFNELKGFEVKGGDIIISCSGVYLGKLAIIPNDYTKGIINQALLKLSLNKDVILNDLFVYFWNNLMNNGFFDEVKKGAAIPNMPSVKELKEINIPLPPLPIQQKVVKYLDEISEKIEKVKSVQKEKMDSLKALKASILDKAFRGEL